MKFPATLLVCLLVLSSSKATTPQVPDIQPSHRLSSPYDAIVLHLGSLQKANYHPEIAAKTFSQTHHSKKEAIQLAIKLKDILDKEGIDIDATTVPNDPCYIDPVAKYHRYQLAKKFHQIYLVKVQGQWIYSEETVQYVLQMIRGTESLGIDKLHNLFPKRFKRTLLGLQLWQYIVLAVLILLLRISYTLLVFISGKLIKWVFKRWIPDYIIISERPVGLIILALLAMTILPIVQLPATVERIIFLLLQGMILLALTIICYLSVNVIVNHLNKMAEGQEGSINVQLLPLLKATLKVLVVIVGTLLILRSLGVDISTLLAGVSIGGVGIALASQDTLKNLFGSLMIFIDRPFSVGDAIVAGKIEGKVEEIGMRSTRIRTTRESIISVPNAKLADESIDNYGMRNYRRFFTRMSIAYDTPAPLIETFIEGLREIVKRHPRIRKDKHFIYLEDMQESRLEILFYIYFSVKSRGKELQCRQEVLLRIIKFANKIGVRFAFPTQTLHMESFPEKKSLRGNQKADISPEKLNKKLQSFLEQE